MVDDADLSDYFNTIPHGDLMRCVSRRIADGSVLSVVKAWLEAPAVERQGRREQRTTAAADSHRGTPQGGVISPMLANLYFRRFVLAWKQFGHERRFQARVVNYADDLVICCRPGNGPAAMTAKVTNTAPNLPSRVVLYAAEKWGKSSFAAYAPRPIFLMTAGETGLLSLIEARKVPAVDHFPEDFQTWQRLVNAVRALRDEKHDFQTLVLDTGNGAENPGRLTPSGFSTSSAGTSVRLRRLRTGDRLHGPEWAKFLAPLDEVRIQ